MTPKTGTKEWMPNSRNTDSGCENDCLYCYGKLRAVRYKQRTKEDWHEARPLKVRQSPKKADGGIMFPTTHDLHYKNKDRWFPFLKEMLENGNDVLIVTKPELDSMKLICKNLKEFSDQIEFRFTMGTDDSAVLNYWEPGAPTGVFRLCAIDYVQKAGFKTSWSMEPLLDKYPELFISIWGPAFTGEIWIGTMNHYKFNPDIPEEAYQMEVQSKENIQRIYNALKNNPKIRWKDSIQRLLGITSEGVKL